MKARYILLSKSRPIQNVSVHMDFEKLIKTHESRTNSSPYRISGALVIIIAMLAILVFKYQAPEPFSAEIKSIIPITPEEVQNAPQGKNEEPKTETTAAVIKENTESEVPPSKEESTPQKTPQEGIIEMSYSKAVPDSGMAHLYEYFYHELRYPEGDTINGVSIGIFTITSEGQIADIEIENSLGEAFDKEVIRLIENMPPWHPATANGTPVDSRMSIPFTFSVK